ELGEARGARVGRGAAQARRDLVEQVLDARTLGVEEHAAGADALLVESLARALERRPAGRARRDRARRGHAEALLVEAAGAVVVQVARRLVGAGEPRPDHHLRRARGE